MSATLSDWEAAATWREQAAEDLVAARAAIRRALDRSPVSTECIELRRLLEEVGKCKRRIESSAVRCQREAEELRRVAQ